MRGCEQLGGGSQHPRPVPKNLAVKWIEDDDDAIETLPGLASSTPTPAILILARRMHVHHDFNAFGLYQTPNSIGGLGAITLILRIAAASTPHKRLARFLLRLSPLVRRLGR